MLELNKIYNMDCLEGLKQIDDNSVDLVITDPPYGDNTSYGRNNKEIQNNNNPLLNCSVLFNLQRIMKKDSTIYNFTNWVHYPFLTEFIIRYTSFNIRQLIVCNKKRFGLGYGFRNKHELIMVLEKGNPTYNLNDLPNVIDFDVINFDENTHPHKKPENIIRKLIKHSSQEGDFVLDPFLGSGTTAIACKQLNRDYIGFELDKNYYDVALKRLKQNTLLGLNKHLEVDENEQE